MEKLSILLLTLGIASSAHGSDNKDSIVLSLRTKLDQISREIRNTRELQLFITPEQLSDLNGLINDVFVDLPTSPRYERTFLQQEAVAANQALTELLKAQSPTKTTANPQITVSEA